MQRLDEYIQKYIHKNVAKNESVKLKSNHAKTENRF